MNGEKAHWYPFLRTNGTHRKKKECGRRPGEMKVYIRKMRNETKTEHLCGNEMDTEQLTMKLHDMELPKAQDFKYLGSTVQKDDGCEEVKKRIQARWNHWKMIMGVICDNVHEKLKGKFYRMVVQLALMYGLETLAITTRQQMLEVADVHAVLLYWLHKKI